MGTHSSTKCRTKCPACLGRLTVAASALTTSSRLAIDPRRSTTPPEESRDEDVAVDVKARYAVAVAIVYLLAQPWCLFDINRELPALSPDLRAHESLRIR